MILDFVDSIFWVYMIMLFLRILGSWLPELRDTKFMRFISHYTDPYLNVFRQIIPPLGAMDFSPIIAFLFLGWVIEPIVKGVIGYLVWIVTNKL